MEKTEGEDATFDVAAQSRLTSAVLRRLVFARETLAVCPVSRGAAISATPAQSILVLHVTGGSVLLKNSKFRTLRFLAQGQFNRASTLPVEHRAFCKRLAAFKHDQRTPRCPRRSNHPTRRELFDRDRKRRCSTESVAGCLSSQHAAVVRHAPARSRRSPPW